MPWCNYKIVILHKKRHAAAPCTRQVYGRHAGSILMATGIFVGSFDPFTIGHQSVVSRALALFDRLVIGVGVNSSKQGLLTPQQRVQAIGRLYAAEPRVSVGSYDGLTVDFARRHHAAFVVKGVRDFEYERVQADINRRLTGLETVLLYAEPGMDSISSSLVRELLHFGHDVSTLLPAGFTLPDRDISPAQNTHTHHDNL